MKSSDGMRHAIVLMGVALVALTIASCAPSSANQQQVHSNEDTLRTMVANDRQQIEALQQEIARQGDRISELEHGTGGSAASAGTSAAPQAAPSSAAAPAAAETTAAQSAGVPSAPAAEASPAATPAAEATLAATEVTTRCGREALSGRAG